MRNVNLQKIILVTSTAAATIYAACYLLEKVIELKEVI